MAYVVYIYEASRVQGQIERQSECRQKDQSVPIATNALEAV